MENETNVAAGRAPVKRFFGAITIVLSLFGCLALGLLIAFGIFISRARAEMVRSQEDQARAVREFQSSLEYQSSLVNAVPTQNSPYQPQQPQYSNPYSTPYGSSPPAMMGMPQSTERMPGSALDAEVQSLAIELRSANSEKRELLNHQLLSKLTESFDARQKSHVSQLTKLQGEVQKTQELIEKREKLKSQIIERRIKELTGQPDELGWDPIAMSVPYGFPSSPSGQGPSTTLPPPGYGYSSVNPNNISVPPPTAPKSESNEPTSKMELETNLQVAERTPEVVGLEEEIAVAQEKLATMIKVFGPSHFNVQKARENLEVRSQVLTQRKAEAKMRAKMTAEQLYERLVQDQRDRILRTQDGGVLDLTGLTALVPKSDVSGIASNSTDPTSQSQTSQRSFITIGFRLKQLLKELADENAINQIPNPSRRAIQLQSSIDETRAGWDFEKLQFKNNLDVIDKEQKLVQRQLENATEAIDVQKNLASKGAANKADVSKAEDQRSEIERQLLQLSSRWANLKQSFDWMNEFEKASLSPQDKEVTTY
ncbi:MAG: hypothetical protein NTU79_07810 [Planctomycetota bacterium]|nr:hypothetical protein [Planctomycetota bacterium]